MYDSGKIITGLLVFVAIVSFPFVYSRGTNIVKPEPKIDTPVIQQMAVKQCVQPRAFMRAEHMQLLNDWRDSVVRDGNRVYVGFGGKQYNMSLQNTCMHCHSNKKEFCDSCHNFMSVKPYCWDCHIAPKENKS
ncbi:MAG: sulfate reduction electron transfer complex DsrMKJOP subunit DsrJ [Nitrospirae bacterium]|nr:sulfate reduction electron transfer complex DsrMKJOP subunit DsrJ [Nitrospirota bacterium]